MKSRICLLWVALTLLIGAAPQVPAAYVVEGDGIVGVTTKGIAGRIRIDPGAPSIPILAHSYAEAIGLKPGLFGAAFLVGPVKVSGSTAVADFVVAGIAFKRRAAWFERDFGPPDAPAVDGVVGPGSIPAPVVRFLIHAPRPGERVVELPLVDAGELIGNWGGLFAQIQIGDKPMKVRFDLHHPYTLANAGSGLRIAQAYGGTLTGPTEKAEIAFGVERPIRRMTLARPLAIGPLLLDQVRVRVSDYGDATSIPDADAVADPDEIIVTAKKKRDRSRDRLSIGLDQLQRCSSLVFDKPAKVVRLSCV